MHRIRKPVLILVVLAVSAGMLMPLITQWLPKRRPSVLGVETLRLILDRGEKALWRQEFEQAREAYQEALDLDPSCAPALIGRGTAYQFLGRHDLAIRDLDLLVEAHPDQPQSYRARALTYRLAGKEDRAIEDLTMALKLGPTDVEAFLQRSAAYRATGRPAQALVDLQKALELQPQNVNAHIELAGMHREEGELDKALASLDHALELDPQSARGFRSRAGILFNRGEYQRAAADFKAAARWRPDYPYLHVRLFLAQSRAGEDAAHALRIYRQTLDDSGDMFTTAIIRACLGELAFEELLALASSNDPKTHKEQMGGAHYYIGQLQLIKGESAAARASFEKCVATGVEDSVEHAGAKAELARMHPQAQAPGPNGRPE